MELKEAINILQNYKPCEVQVRDAIETLLRFHEPKVKVRGLINWSYPASRSDVLNTPECSEITTFTKFDDSHIRFTTRSNEFFMAITQGHPIFYMYVRDISDNETDWEIVPIESICIYDEE